MLFPCLLPTPQVSFGFSESIPRDEGCVLPSLAGHPLFLYCKTNKVRFAAIQANTGDLVIAADSVCTGLSAEEMVLGSGHSVTCLFLDLFGVYLLGLFRCSLRDAKGYNHYKDIKWLTAFIQVPQTFHSISRHVIMLDFSCLCLWFLLE